MRREKKVLTVSKAESVAGTDKVGNDPVKEALHGPNGAFKGPSLGTALPSNLCQDVCNVGLRHWDERRRLSDLAHGRNDKVGVEQLHRNARPAELFA